MDIVELDRLAVEESVRIVDQAKPDDWDRPTPCSEWTLRQLVAHMAGQHRGFAAAAGGRGADPDAWRDLPLGEDPRSVYRDAANEVLDAFARPGAAEARFAIPEISTKTQFPGSMAIGFHFLDYVVHGWDAAASLGLPFEPSAQVAGAVLHIAGMVPDDERRRGPEAQFQPALPDGSAAGPLAAALAMLGRSPDWSA